MREAIANCQRQSELSLQSSEYSDSDVEWRELRSSDPNICEMLREREVSDCSEGRQSGNSLLLTAKDILAEFSISNTYINHKILWDFTIFLQY